MPWPICTIIARNRIISKFIMSRRGFGVPITSVLMLVIVSVSLHQQHINNRCKIEHENVQRWQILIYVCCFILLLSCMTACKLMDTCLVSQRLQYPLPKLLPLHWWWWSSFLIMIVFILFKFIVFIMKISPLSHGFCTKWISRAVISLHCVTRNDWDTCKYTKKHLFPLASQIPHKPLCLQTFT